MTTKVALRQKKISKGRKSLYLDFYPPIPHPKTGKPTRREFLGLYIFEKVKNPIDKKHNSETLKIAESIRQKRENFLNKPEIYSHYEKEQLKIKERGEKCFIDYYRQLANKRKNSTHENWISALNYLESFFGGTIKFADLNESVLEDFKEYLLTTKSKRSDKVALSTNTAASYFVKVKVALKQAYKDGNITIDLNSRIKPIKEVETRREHLTFDELNSLVKTQCNNPLIKRVALFSALTSLAFREIKNLKWKDISLINDKGYLILTKRQKTQNDNYLPINDQAYGLTEGKQNPKDMPQEESVFKGLTYSAFQNKQLSNWISAAGITKHITFHCLRHTYAVLQLYKGTDIYTVSKMMGHKYLQTTQIYAKIVDETKREATNKIKLDL